MIDVAILSAIQDRLARAFAIDHTHYHPLVVDRVRLGWFDDDRFARLAQFNDVFRIADGVATFVARLSDCNARSAAMADIAQALRAEGALPAWRDETYAVAPEFGAPPAFHLERGAARWFGVRTWAAHVNGLVHDNGDLRMWFARRSPTKAVDAGLFDNLVGGGIAAGMRVDATVVKEAWEEAGIAAHVARRARPAGAVHVRRKMFDGLERETLFVHDLALPKNFVPANQDGEAVGHRLVDLTEAARLIAQDGTSEDVTVDASVVVLDWLLRHGAIVPDAPGYIPLSSLRFSAADR